MRINPSKLDADLGNVDAEGLRASIDRDIGEGGWVIAC